VKLLKTLGIIVGIIAVIIIAFAIFMSWGQHRVTATKLNYINLNNIADGNYVGTFDGYRWTNSVRVSVQNHKITNISVVKGQMFRVKEVEDKLFSNVIDKQSIQVDSISGATISSKAILKAIENALE
jgi:uncharacterized protein with FMN-binding domain